MLELPQSVEEKGRKWYDETDTGRFYESEYVYSSEGEICETRLDAEELSIAAYKAGYERALADLINVPHPEGRPSPARVVRVIDGLGLCWEEQGYTGESAKTLFTDAMTFAHIAEGSSCTAPHEDWVAKFLQSEEALEKMGYVSPVRPD